MTKPEAADSAMVPSAQAGNRAAFGTLYERYKPLVHGILLAHVPYAEVDDLLQNVFLQALQRLPDLRDPSAFGGWLAAITRNAAADFHRKKKNFVEIDDRTAAPRDASHSHESAVALAAIRRLPEAYRETLMLRLVEGMTGPEIAARTNLTPDSVRVNLCRGMKLLRTELGRDDHA